MAQSPLRGIKDPNSNFGRHGAACLELSPLLRQDSFPLLDPKTSPQIHLVSLIHLQDLVYALAFPSSLTKPYVLLAAGGDRASRLPQCPVLSHHALLLSACHLFFQASSSGGIRVGPTLLHCCVLKISTVPGTLLKVNEYLLNEVERMAPFTSFGFCRGDRGKN